MLVPGICPEPYWDLYMGTDFNYYSMKQNMKRAIKTPLKEEESKCLINGLHADPELVLHIGMTHSKLPSLVVNNSSVAYELLIGMTYTN